MNWGIMMEELPKSWMVIQGFNLKSQCAVDMIRLELILRDISSSSIFYMIDFKTTYKLLLGHPELQEHGIVALTLHQRPKY